MPGQLPSGLVTFYFSDIEGSTRLVQSLSEGEWAAALNRHFEITEEALRGTLGTKIRTEGDAFFLVFDDPLEAASVALAVQRGHQLESWPAGVELRVRIGLHSGLAALGGDDYVGFDVHLAARIAAAGHGGQTVVSAEAARRIRDVLPDGARLDDLGSHRLKDIAEPHRLYQLTAPDLEARFPALRSEGRGELRVPPDATAFVGREREIADVVGLMSVSRLVTLTGPGGSGKTRLSKRVAESIVDDYPDGIYFVDLSSVEDPRLVIPAVLTALGVHQTRGASPLDLVIRALERSRTCLILDNLEQVIESRQEISKLLAGTERAEILATSRGPLRIAGEREYPVPPLPLPDAHEGGDLTASEAVQLFSARARDIDPEFSLDGANGPAVAEIVTKLDGLPLAIELAAARTRLLSPPDLLARLDSSLEVLKSRRTDIPERQQTLRGAIRWSYDLLDEEAQWLFADVSVFAGGCRLKELVRVCRPRYPDQLEDLLEDLLEQSMVKREGSRYRMLVTIREFGLERLAERGNEAETRDYHALAYRLLAEEAAPSLLTVERPATLNLLAADHDNFRAALDWVVERGDVDMGLAIAGSLWRFWQMRGHLVEARERLIQVTDLEGGDPVLKAKALEGLGGVAYWQGDFAAARVAYQESLDLLRDCGTESEIANGLYNLSFSYGFAGDTEPAKELLDEAAEIYRRLGEGPGLAKVAWGFGTMYHIEGRNEDARQSFAEAVDGLRGGDDDFSFGWAVDRLGVMLSALGEIEEARKRLTEALDLFTLAEDISAQTIIFNDFADNALRAGDPERALRISGIVQTLMARSGAALVDTMPNEVQGLSDAVVAVGEKAAQRLQAEGRAMSTPEALAYVREGV